MAERDERKGLDERRLSPALIGGIVLALAAIAFVAQNRDEVTIHFLFFDIESRIWTLLLVTSVLAIVAAELIGMAIRRSRRRQRSWRRRLRSLCITPSGSAFAHTARHSSRRGYMSGTSSGRMRLSLAK